MPTFIHHIATGVPTHRYHQSDIRDWMQAKLGTSDRRSHKLIQLAYDRSGIETRHSVLPDFHQQGGGDRALGLLASDDPPTTGERNDRYIPECRELATRVARDTFDADHGFCPADITHLITVSCTGFSAPGVDLDLIKWLELDPSVKRTHIGFMGCCAAFPALRTADDICLAHPDALVLVVCIELCTLHLKHANDPDSLISASVFADGCATALVSARAPSGPGFALEGFATTVVPDTEQEMAWRIGDEGFDMVLSSYIPRILGASIRDVLRDSLSASEPAVFRHWAVHPGGRAILDHVEQGLGLPSSALASSRDVLRNFGNMSSATILFVLRNVLDTDPEAGRVASLAFGPGLTVESACLVLVPGQGAGHA